MVRAYQSFPTFDLAWATGGSTQAEPTAGEKVSGWSAGQKPPAKKVNWLLDAPNKWLQVVMGMLIGKYKTLPAIGAGPGAGAIAWCPLTNQWVCGPYGSAGGTGSAVFCSDGINWGVGATTANVLPGSGLYDNTGRVIFSGKQNYYLVYASAPGSSFSTSNACAEYLGKSATKQTDDFIAAVALTASYVYVASSVALAGAWTEYATPVNFVDIVYLTGTTWLGLGTNGTVYVSTDDCATWASRGTPSSVISETVYESIEHDPSTGVLCVMASNSGTGNVEIAYSVDLGVTWSLSTLEHSAAVASDGGKLRCLGGPIWMAACGNVYVNGGTYSGLIFSIDKGVTWRAAFDEVDEARTLGQNIVDIEFNGYEWLAGYYQAELKGGPFPF